MCKGCSKVVSVVEMKDGYCQECYVPTKQAETIVTTDKRNYITKSIRVGSPTGEEDALFGGKKEVTYREYCAMSELSENIDKACNNLHNDGYEVISILPIIRGDWGYTGDGGYGFSVTDGVIITAKAIK